MPVETMAWVTDPVTFLLAGLVLFFLAVGYAVIRGGLVARRTVDILIKQWEARLVESRERELAWREAYETTEKARATVSEQVGQLIVIGKTTEALLRALPNGRSR